MQGERPLRRLSPLQERFWFLGRIAPDAPATNAGVLVRAGEPVAGEDLAAALAEVVARHRSLRLRVAIVDGEVLAETAEPAPAPGLDEVDAADPARARSLTR